jgi:para-nitrobenzyl esterase
MTVPATRGLFARAVAESPASTWEAMPTLAAAEALGARLAGKLGVADGTPEQLRAIPADRLLSAIAGNLPGPTIDGRLITQSVPKAFSGGSAAAVPLVIGTTSYEASLLEGESLPLDRVPAGVRAAYADDGVSGQALGDAIFTDHEFVAPVRWLARQATKHAAVWVYHFSYVRVSQRQKTPGAPHASELPFVFSSWDKMSARAALLPAEDRAMTALVHSCWVAFARGGAPVCQGAPAWPAYKVDGGNSDSLLEFGLEPEVRRHFRQKQLDAQDLAAAGHS